jgi:hypothetical protein
LNTSTSVIEIMNSMRMKWARHVEGIGEKRNAYRLLARQPESSYECGNQLSDSVKYKDTIEWLHKL